jgi:hypothetical protein
MRCIQTRQEVISTYLFEMTPTEMNQKLWQNPEMRVYDVEDAMTIEDLRIVTDLLIEQCYGLSKSESILDRKLTQNGLIVRVYKSS